MFWKFSIDKLRKIFELHFVIFAKHSIKMLVNFSSPYNRSFVLGRFSADVSNVVNETNFDLWKTVAPFFKKKVDHHHIRFCALAGYGWSKWRGQELWGNCYGQKGRSKVISKSSIIGFVC